MENEVKGFSQLVRNVRSWGRWAEMGHVSFDSLADLVYVIHNVSNLLFGIYTHR